MTSTAPTPRPHRCPAVVLGATWIEAEEFAYPHGGLTRRAYVELRANPNNPIDLPYGRRYIVTAGIPDTVFTIPARLRYRGRTIAGFVSIQDGGEPAARLTFTPEAA